MDNSTFHHIVVMLGLYIFLFISYYGWGSLTSTVLGLDLYSQRRYFFYSIWIGWCTGLLIFQLINFFSAIDWKISCIVYLSGIILATGFSRRNVAKIRRGDSKDLTSIIFFLVIVSFILIWVVFRGMRIANNYDSGLYHFNFIRWINTYPIIPGLGNLHARLGFNQTFFVYAASLNFFPYFPYAHSIGNGFLFLLVTAEIVSQLMFLAQKRRAMEALPVYSYVPYIFGFFLIIWSAVTGQDMSSPTPDLASFFIQLILFLWFIRFILATREKEFPVELAFSLIILATTLITIKLSNLVFAGILMGVCMFYALKFTKTTEIFQRYTRISIFLCALFIIWVVRGYYLSGYPFYPASFGSLPFSWTIPIESVKGLESIIYSWARTFGHPANEVPGSWSWLYPWFVNVYRDYKINVIYPVCTSFILFVLSIVMALKTGKLHLLRSDAIFLMPIIAGLLFWFFSAPDPRFANALFLLLLLNTATLFLSRLYELAGFRVGFVFVQGITLIFTIFLLRSCYLIIVYDFRDPYVAIPRVALTEKLTQSGLNLYIPTSGFQCWDAPLPCTPYYNQRLRLIVHGDLSSGFIIK